MNEALFWVDLETTGLDPDKDQVLEIAYIITDMQLNVIRTAEYVFELDPVTFSAWDPFVKEMHTNNNLIEDCRLYGMYSEFVWSMVKDQVSGFKEMEGVEKLYLAGSTVGFDSQFIKRNAPDLHTLFHYRSLDVTSLKLAASMAGMELKVGDEKPHRAMQDIKDSLACARLFKDWLDDYYTYHRGFYKGKGEA
jgi:oligoribonuclease